MQISFECFPCFLRQGLWAAKRAGANYSVTRKILNEIGTMFPDIDMHESPPKIGQALYNIVSNYTKSDPFEKEKKISNDMGLAIYPVLLHIVEKDGNLLAALKIAALGNMLDFGAYTNMNIKTIGIEEEISQLSKKAFAINDMPSFERKLKKAKTLLYIGDNAGEIVFDKILISHLKKYVSNIYFAVRGKPVINDVTLEDAYYVGMDKLAKIIDSGTTAPGCIPHTCSKEFDKLFLDSDIVIAKGQGNFEAMEGYKRKVFYLFRVKCSVISNYIGVPTESSVFIEK